MSSKQRPSIVVVCTANVCRSPLAEFLLRSDFASAEGFEGVSVVSAGVRAAGHLVCSRVRFFREDPEWQMWAGAHVPREPVVDELENAQLVLAASKGARGQLVRLAPKARSRIFTLKEALWLGDGYVRPASVVGRDAVADFTAFLDSQRGLRAPLESPRSFDPRRRPADATAVLSITDGHTLNERAHRRTVDEVAQVTTHVARLIAGAETPDAAAI